MLDRCTDHITLSHRLPGTPLGLPIHSLWSAVGVKGDWSGTGVGLDGEWSGSEWGVPGTGVGVQWDCSGSPRDWVGSPWESHTTRGFSKTGCVGTGMVVDFGTPRHTAYPYRGVTGMHG